MSQTILSKEKPVWILGDHYHSWISFEHPRQVSNDPDFRPGHSRIGRQPHQLFLAGGVWQIRRFYEAILGSGDLCDLIPEDTIAKVDNYDRSDAGMSRLSSAHFVVKEYPRYPGAEKTNTVFRISDHFGYASATHELRREAAGLEALNRKRETVLPQIEEIDLIKPKLGAKPLLRKIIAERDRYVKAEEVLHKEFLLKSAKNLFPKVIVVNDMDMGAREIDVLGNILKGRPRNQLLVVQLERGIPGSKNGDLESPLWKQVFPRGDREKGNSNTLLIVNADLLRFSGANISRRLSWERTAGDCLKAIQFNARLGFLLRFRYIIVRFGIAAALYCEVKDNAVRQKSLFFDVKSSDGIFRDQEVEGGMVGNNSVYGACITKYYLQEGGVNMKQVVTRAIRQAIPACQSLFRHGFEGIGDWFENSLKQFVLKPRRQAFEEQDLGSKIREGQSISGWEWPKPEWVGENADQSCPENTPSKYKPVEQRQIATFDRFPKNLTAEWSIAKTELEAEELVGFARAIVKKGFDVAMRHRIEENRAGFPIAQFGNISVVDRYEIEGFRAASNILRQYLSDLKRGKGVRPCSIAVFGPPGSGKSFAVKEIVRALDPSIYENAFEINLSQLSSFDELASLLIQLNKVLAEGKIPFVFFDEFDCKLGEDELGWLRYFLAPMEDGMIRHPREGVIKLPRGIFVFAGGVSETFEEFNEQRIAGRGNLGSDAAKAAKLPDFVSRLRAIIDIKGVNDPNPRALRGRSIGIHTIRRALILRHFLEELDVAPRGGDARIDGGMLNGLLLLRKFRHNSRSLRVIITMCMRLHGWIEMASLPTSEILRLHLGDLEEEFFELVAKNPDYEERVDTPDAPK